jgi:hypothetical protein
MRFGRGKVTRPKEPASRATVLADQRASAHSLRCECASLGEGTRGVGCESDPPLSGAAKSGAHVPVYRCRRCVRRTERSTAASSRLDRGETTPARLRGAGRAGAGRDCGQTRRPPGAAQAAPGTAHASVPGLADIKPETRERMQVGHKEEGSPTARGLHLVDSDGIIRFVRGNDLSAGRSVDEVLRVLDALRSGQVFPCEWHPGVRPRSRDSTRRGEQWNRSRRMPCVCPPFRC